MRTLWGRANSSNVMKVVWLMEELSLPYQRIDVGGPFGRTHDADYLAMNPNSTVPTLVEEDGFTLWESNVILRYLAGQHAGATQLWPAEPRARADVDRWMDWQHTVLGPPMTAVFQGLVRTAPEQRNQAAIEAAAAKLGQAWRLLDGQLAGRDYITGPDLSLADVALGVYVHRWFSLPLQRPDLPHVRAWYDRLLARPAYRQHCATPLT